MTSRLSRILFRTVSASDTKRSSSPVSDHSGYQSSTDSCLHTHDNPTSGRRQSLIPGGFLDREMNILQKAVNHVPGHDARKERRDSRDDRVSKDKHKQPVGKQTQKPEPPKPAKLSIEMESPPLAMYGSAATSSGALMSGQFKMTVDRPEVEIDMLELELVIEQTNKKPVERQCSECTTKRTVLRQWKFVSEPTIFKQGFRQFPFSYLLEGHLPASTDTPLGSISYVLQGKGNLSPRSGSVSSGSTTTGAGLSTQMPVDIKVSHVLNVFRAIPPPETDRTAIRVFPPTNLQATCTLPPLIHPISNGFPVLLRLSGVAEHADHGRTVRTWRLKKLTWRLEELTTVVSQACDKHVSRVGGQGRGVKHESVVTLGGKELREGWKADYAPPSLKDTGKDASSGTVEIELICGPEARRRDDTRPACDVDTPSGFTVRHKLVIECVVTEELHPIDKPKWVAPTGVARILRMGYEIRVTERMGLGISWDEEQPPIYDDVPESPPGYIRGQETTLGDDVAPLEAGGRPIPGRASSNHSEETAFEPPPSYAENRMGIADDEEWDVHHVSLSEGIRPHRDSGEQQRSSSRGLSPGVSPGLSPLTSPAIAGPSGWRQPNNSNSSNTRLRLDASDLEADPFADMMRGRQQSEGQGDNAQVGQRDE